MIISKTKLPKIRNHFPHFLAITSILSNLTLPIFFQLPILSNKNKSPPKGFSRNHRLP